jgi:L,D-transpeptidase catalytic domain
VHGVEFDGRAPESRPESTSGTKTGSRVAINIDKAKQKMTVSIDGVKKYDSPVSTGRPEYSTPSGTYTPISMNEVWYSQQWDNSPMPHSIFFMKDGHAIHGSYEVKTLGKAVSHGCVRISPQNAATLYSLVGKNGLKNTQVVLTGVTPGGESKVASQSGPGRTPGGNLRWRAGRAMDPVMPRRVPAGTGAATSPRGAAAFSDVCLAVPITLRATTDHHHRVDIEA